jgi:DNA-binding winged helix-turn-helix (wHTH) protein
VRLADTSARYFIAWQQHRVRPTVRVNLLFAAVAADPMKYSVGDLTIDTGRQLVVRAVDPIALPKLSYDLLLVLMRAAPNLVSLDELMQLVWPGIIVSPETVSQRVKLLRDALGDDPRVPRYIGGLRGRGYRIVPVVNPARGSEPDPNAAGTPAPVPAMSVPGKPIPPATSAWRAVSAIAIALIAP